MTKTSKTFERIHTFDTDEDARTAKYGAVARRYSGQGLKFEVVPGTLPEWGGKFLIKLINRETGLQTGLATETVTHGVSFDKPVLDQWRETSTQVVRKDGDQVALIECEFDLEDQGATTTTYVRVGTDSYEVVFPVGHPLAGHGFTFVVQRADAGQKILDRFTGKHFIRKGRKAGCDEHGTEVVFADARKALVAAKRFCKAVL